MVSLKAVATVLNGDRSSNYPSKNDFLDYGEPFINAGHLQNGTIDYTNMDYISSEKLNSLSGARIQSGDILLCLRGSLGKYAVVSKSGGAPASSIAVIRADAKVMNPNFLAHVVSSSIFQKQIEIENNGSSQPNLSASSVENFLIPYPDVIEQERIATALSDMDELIASLEKLISKKKAIKQGTMQELLTGKRRLPGFSGEWKPYLYMDICSLINGRAYSQPELLNEGKYKVLRLGNLFTNEKWYYSDLELSEKQYCDTGDLIYAWSATFGPYIWEKERVIYHYHIWKVICSELINKQFLYYYFLYDTQKIKNEVQGGTMAYFADAFDGYWLSLPDGQNLATYIVDTTDDYIIYSSPILLNDEETNLRIRQTYDGAITVEGAWDGIGNNGISSRNIVKIGTGDTIIPVYYSYDWDDEEDVYYGEEYDVEGKLRVDYSLLLEGEYLYSFCIDDIYGDYYMTDPVAFYVDADGEVMFGY